MAAFIQQKFDTYVYTMPWNRRIFGDDKNVSSEIAQYSEKILSNNAEKEKLKNWYTVEADRKPLNEGILVCQRENFTWDAGLRKRFRRLSIGVVVLLSGAVLIMGVMIGYVAGAIIQILQYLSSAEQLKMFTLWSMGSLGHITTTQLGIMTPMLCLGLLISIVCIKPLNLLLLGENYARTMGMNIKRSRTLIFISTALLTGTVTAFCGPVGFIGLAVPHVTRLLFNNADHRILVPATMLTGLISMLLCDIIAKKFLLPVNCITALLGVPVILWVIAKNLHGFK